MGLTKLYSRVIHGTKAHEVIVEVHVANGLPSFSIVGLADTEVRESRDRVRSAIQMSGFDFPARRITVNLAPADLPKDSGRYDLPIALGILLASGLIDTKLDTNIYEFAGELGLDGGLRKISGALTIAYNAKINSRILVLPIINASEASLVDGVKIIAIDNLIQLVKHFNGNQNLPIFNKYEAKEVDDFGNMDFNQVKGQISVKKAFEAAASGRHSILMVGNPGCGKSMLASRFITILPQLSIDEGIETASLYSITNGGFDLKKWRKVPFRSPHHSSSSIAIVGGGANPKPGEISLAHNGVLFLDEMPEFDRRVLEVLREPLETKNINIARANHKVEFPADFQLVGAMNPCPCGNLNHPKVVCKCTPEQVNKYKGKLSAPLLDRIDLLVQVSNLSPEELRDIPSGESSSEIKERVIFARKIQLKRQNKLNGELNHQELSDYCTIDKNGIELLNQVSERFAFSARSYNRLIKISRTLADLEGKDVITQSHVAQSVQYRVSL